MPRLRRRTDPFPLKKPRESRLRRHPLAAMAAVLALSLAAVFLVLRTIHETQWFYLAAGLSLASIFAGRLIGEKAWPILGSRVCRLVLRLYTKWGYRKGARLLIAPDADFVPGPLRQTWESMAFATGLAVATGATILFATQGAPRTLLWASIGGLVLCGTLTVLVVPHWVFARLGLRLWEPRRFLSTSLSESYSGLVRVGNGTLLIGAAIYGVNIVAQRAPRMESYSLVAFAIAGVLGFSIAVFGTAAAYFQRHQEKLVKQVAADARRLGFTNLRNEFDGLP